MLSSKHGGIKILQNELTNHRHKQLPRYLVTVVDKAINTHCLSLAKSSQCTEKVIANRLFVAHIKSLDIADLLDDTVKALYLPMVVMDELEVSVSELFKRCQIWFIEPI